MSVPPSLIDNVRSAVAAEFTTLPAYLYAYWSIKPSSDGGSEAAERARESVMVVIEEEMLHMALASNLLNALRGTPCLTERPYLPEYPCRLLRSVVHTETNSAPVELLPFDEALAMMLAIEKPEWSPGSGPTLGEFYERDVLDLLPKDPGSYGGGHQILPWGNPGPGTLFSVSDRESARRAVHEIIVQGEGLSERTHSDGQHELAHYWRFQEIQDAVDDGSLDLATDVYRVVASPGAHLEQYSAEQRAANHRFNVAYSEMLDALEAMLVDDRPDAYPTAAGRMRSLQLLAEQLRRIGPIPGSDRCAGPTFEFLARPDRGGTAPPAAGY